MQDAIDVRTLVPSQRHQKLIAMFKALPPGESFTFINDHDPKPLFYEFRSIFGDVVDWEYLTQGGAEWIVQVTRTEESQGRELAGAATLIDLRKTAQADWEHTVLHRFSMLSTGDVMRILAAVAPEKLHSIFQRKLSDEHIWTYEKEGPDEFSVRVEKRSTEASAADGTRVIMDFDVRPHPPALRHDMVFEAFDALNTGEAFIFINDHDPKPLYFQLEAESKVPFTWEYLAKGPTEWKVRVAKS